MVGGRKSSKKGRMKRLLDLYDAASRAGLHPFIHVDEDYLNGSTHQGLAGLLLHEAWHLLGYANHTSGPPYTQYPFSEQYTCPL
jgi:hypothetical protein